MPSTEGIRLRYLTSSYMLNIMVGDRPVEEMWNEILDNYKTDGLEDVIKAVNESAK